MSIFSKGGDVLDLTLLKKKGLLKINDNRVPEVVDLRPQASSAGINNATSEDMSSVSAAVSPFDMMNSLAAASSDAVSSGAGSEFNSSAMGSVGDLKLNPDFSGLNVRVENLEYKLERLMEKFLAVESRIEDSKNKTMN